MLGYRFEGAGKCQTVFGEDLEGILTSHIVSLS